MGVAVKLTFVRRIRENLAFACRLMPLIWLQLLSAAIGVSIALRAGMAVKHQRVDRMAARGAGRRRTGTTGPARRGHSAAGRAGSGPRVLFSALDGLKLGVARQHWRIEVFGIADAARRRWIQLALRGRNRHRMLTLSFRRSDNAERIVETVMNWLSNPVDRPECIHAEAVSR